MTPPRVARGPQRRDFAEKAIRDGGGEPSDVDAQADALVWLNPADIDGLRAALQTAGSARWVQLPFAGVERVAAAGISASVRDGRVRVGFHLYNTADDVERLLGAFE